jgi:hypothetical protein
MVLVKENKPLEIMKILKENFQLDSLVKFLLILKAIYTLKLLLNYFILFKVFVTFIIK